jgi:hypothetical protein
MRQELFNRYARATTHIRKLQLHVNQTIHTPLLSDTQNIPRRDSLPVKQPTPPGNTLTLMPNFLLSPSAAANFTIVFQAALLTFLSVNARQKQNSRFLKSCG